jgi:hypothetical protein
MIKRASFSTAFVVGGIITLLILLALQGFAQAEAGMSAVSVSAEGPSDSAIIFVICGYFFLSAFGIAVSKTKSALWLWAALVHALLVIDYIMMLLSVKSGDPDGHKWLSEAGELMIIMTVYFAPWLILWRIILLSKKRKENL